MKHTVLGAAIAMVLGGQTAWAAPRNASTTPSSIALNTPPTMTVTAEAGQWPALGDWITFKVSYPKTVDKYGARIQILCYQNGQLVYAEADWATQPFLLGSGSSPWLNDYPGPASCHADLYYWSYNGGQKFNWLASTDFEAAGKSE